MIDIHTHILPGVDDGCKDYASAKQMVINEIWQGVTEIVLTPHFRYNYNKPYNELVEKFNEFKQELNNDGVEIKLHLGQEIFVDKDYKKILASDSVNGIDRSKIILIEFDYNKEIDYADVVFEIKHMGFTPIVAHVERYAHFTLEDAFEIKDIGGYIQINSSSLMKKRDKKEHKFVRKLLNEGLVDFVASDKHFDRENCLLSAYEFVVKHYDEEYADAIFKLNQQALLESIK